MAGKSRSDQQRWHPYIFVICICPGRSGFGLVGWSGWVVCADVCPTTKLRNSRHLWKCTPGIHAYAQMNTQIHIVDKIATGVTKIGSFLSLFP